MHVSASLLPALLRNVHLLQTNIFVSEEQSLKHQFFARNHRLLHNWQRVCVLLASYRANCASVIRDSVLQLIPDVMDFLLTDK
jgi:hypothetical protein